MEQHLINIFLKDFIANLDSVYISGTMSVLLLIYHLWKRHSLNKIREKESQEYKTQLLDLANNITFALSNLIKIKERINAHCAENHSDHEKQYDRHNEIRKSLDRMELDKVEKELEVIRNTLDKIKSRVDVNQELIKTINSNLR